MATSAIGAPRAGGPGGLAAFLRIHPLSSGRLPLAVAASPPANKHRPGSSRLAVIHGVAARLSNRRSAHQGEANRGDYAVAESSVGNFTRMPTSGVVGPRGFAAE
jgi:hypothetical protein